MPKPAVSGCPSTRGRIFLSVVSYVVKRKKGLASWRSPFCFSGTNAPVDVVTLFQSTPPRGGRLRRVLAPTSIWHFNPRPPRGGRHGLARKAPAMLVFQTTPPYEGGDCGCTSGTSPSPDFNPRPPRGGRQQKQPKFQAVFTTSRQFFQISPPNSDSISKNKVTCSRKTPRNLVRTCGDFPRTCASHLKHQHILRSIGCLYSKMLNLLFVAVPQVVKTQTVFFLIHDFT